MKIDESTNKKDSVDFALRNLMDKYGSLVSTDLSAYDGIDHTGMFGGVMKRSLKGNAESRLGPTPMDAERNMHQQAGFSAETIETTKINKEYIRAGKSTRSARMDDLGHTNDQIVDLADFDVDEMGNKILVAGSSVQMKFLGMDGAQAFTKLCGSDCDKYWQGNVKVKIPKDYYDGFVAKADQKIEGLKKEIKTLQTSKADSSVIATKKAQLQKIEKIKSKTIPAKTTYKEALEARKNPRLYTAKTLAASVNEAGIAGAQCGAAVGGGCAIVYNMVAILEGKDIDEALKDVAASTGESAVRGYVKSSAGSLVKGGLEHYMTGLPNALKKSGIYAEAAGFIVNSAESMYGYFSGKYSGMECMGLIAKDLTLTLARLPLANMGAFVGMLPMALASVSVGIVKQAMASAQMAKERRIQIEAECKAQIALLKQFRERFEQISRQWLKETTHAFVSAMNSMDDALQIGDIDKYIGAANSITEAMGQKVQFRNQKEFDSLMESDEAFVL